MQFFKRKRPLSEVEWDALSEEEAQRERNLTRMNNDAHLRNKWVSPALTLENDPNWTEPKLALIHVDCDMELIPLPPLMQGWFKLKYLTQTFLKHEFNETSLANSDLLGTYAPTDLIRILVVPFKYTLVKSLEEFCDMVLALDREQLCIKQWLMDTDNLPWLGNLVPTPDGPCNRWSQFINAMHKDMLSLTPLYTISKATRSDAYDANQHVWSSNLDYTHTPMDTCRLLRVLELLPNDVAHKLLMTGDLDLVSELFHNPILFQALLVKLEDPKRSVQDWFQHHLFFEEMQYARLTCATYMERSLPGTLDNNTFVQPPLTLDSACSVSDHLVPPTTLDACRDMYVTDVVKPEYRTQWNVELLTPCVLNDPDTRGLYTQSEFDTRLRNLVGPWLNTLAWSSPLGETVLVGSVVGYCATRTPVWKKTSLSDIDLMLRCDKDTFEALVQLHVRTFQTLWPDRALRLVKVSNSRYRVLGGLWNVDLFRIPLHVTVWKKVVCFNFGCNRLYYDGTTTYCFPSYVLAARTGMNVGARNRGGLLQTLPKYSERGFGFMLNTHFQHYIASQCSHIVVYTQHQDPLTT